MIVLGWSNTGSMNHARAGHTASVLTNGKVLVTGGWNYNYNYSYMNSAELYDPSTGTWINTGNMNNARAYHTASLLINGKVLVAGGWNYNYNYSYMNSAELYDPSTGTWINTGNMNNARAYHTASLLTNGKVLVAGGWNYYYNYSYMNSAELYDPSTGTWINTGNMNIGRDRHTASVLTNGKVLVAGGWNYNISDLNNAELYDLSAGTWTTTDNMNDRRYEHTASVLPSGKVLVAGGLGTGGILNSAELYELS